MVRLPEPGEDESRAQAYGEVVEWRIGFLAEAVWEVMPFKDPLPWREVATLAYNHIDINGYKEEDEMFTREGYSDFFVNPGYIERHTSEIINYLAQFGQFVYVEPFVGVRKAHNSQETEETLERVASQVNGIVKNYNLRAEYANNFQEARVPLLNMALLPAGDDKE